MLSLARFKTKDSLWDSSTVRIWSCSFNVLLVLPKVSAAHAALFVGLFDSGLTLLISSLLSSLIFSIRWWSTRFKDDENFWNSSCWFLIFLCYYWKYYLWRSFHYSFPKQYLKFTHYHKCDLKVDYYHLCYYCQFFLTKKHLLNSHDFYLCCCLYWHGILNYYY